MTRKQILGTDIQYFANWGANVVHLFIKSLEDVFQILSDI